MMQFSDRNFKALKTIKFVKTARKSYGNIVKKIDATIPSPCQISGQLGFNVDFGEHGLLLGLLHGSIMGDLYRN